MRMLLNVKAQSHLFDIRSSPSVELDIQGCSHEADTLLRHMSPYSCTSASSNQVASCLSEEQGQLATSI